MFESANSSLLFDTRCISVWRVMHLQFLIMFKSLFSSYVFGSDATTPSSINTSSPNGLSKMKFNKHCVVLIGLMSPKKTSVENVVNIFINVCPELARYCVVLNRF